MAPKAITARAIAPTTATAARPAASRIAPARRMTGGSPIAHPSTHPAATTAPTRRKMVTSQAPRNGKRAAARTWVRYCALLKATPTNPDRKVRSTTPTSQGVAPGRKTKKYSDRPNTARRSRPAALSGSSPFSAASPTPDRHVSSAPNTRAAMPGTCRKAVDRYVEAFSATDPVQPDRAPMSMASIIHPSNKPQPIPRRRLGSFTRARSI